MLGRGRDAREARHVKDYSPSGRFASATPNASPMPPEAQSHLDKGIEFFNQRKYQEALKAFDQAIALDPQDANPWNGKGIVLNTLGQHPEALTAFDQAIALDPQFSYPWPGKGLVFQATHNLPAAHTCYLRCFALDRNYYLRKVLRSHLDLIENYPQPAWLQILYLYLPGLCTAASWSSLTREAETQN
ncbi:MAG: hypothetical protein OHK0039_44110 [Bacteroidia bacterium]